MIAFLRGVLLEKHPNQAVVDVGGVGYDVTIPVSTFSVLPELKEKVELRVHTHVREDAIALFGFATVKEKGVFEKLITVSGIGPSLAIKTLSGLAVDALVNAVRAGAVDQLVRIPGVGKKTAERIVLELRDKLDSVGGAAPAGIAPVVFDAVESDVISALTNLGLARPAAENALRKARSGGAGGDFETLFRKSLEHSR